MKNTVLPTWVPFLWAFQFECKLEGIYSFHSIGQSFLSILKIVKAFFITLDLFCTKMLFLIVAERSMLLKYKY